MSIKVQAACCPKCDKPIKLAATETSFDRATTREFAKLMESGYVLKSMSIEDARKTEMCFDQKHLEYESL